MFTDILYHSQERLKFFRFPVFREENTSPYQQAARVWRECELANPNCPNIDTCKVYQPLRSKFPARTGLPENENIIILYPDYYLLIYYIARALHAQQKLYILVFKCSNFQFSIYLKLSSQYLLTKTAPIIPNKFGKTLCKAPILAVSRIRYLDICTYTANLDDPDCLAFLYTVGCTTGKGSHKYIQVCVYIHTKHSTS